MNTVSGSHSRLDSRMHTQRASPAGSAVLAAYDQRRRGENKCWCCASATLPYSCWGFPGADASKVSSRAKAKGSSQCGTLGQATTGSGTTCRCRSAQPLGSSLQPCTNTWCGSGFTYFKCIPKPRAPSPMVWVQPRFPWARCSIAACVPCNTFLHLKAVFLQTATDRLLHAV